MTHITAKDLTAWARGNREAQGDLPILIRRLVHATTSDASKIDFPGGDSIGTPGSDGVVIIGKGNAWVPDGESLWEVSCRADCKTKAKEDCQKWDDNKISAEERAKKSFIFVTPHIWPQRDKKGEWEEEMRKQYDWGQVRVLDADNLEQWIERSVSVQTWMAMKLGHPSAIPGVSTLEEELDRWTGVTSPEMSPNIVQVEREDAMERVIKHLSKPPNGPIKVVADSRDEAVAFVCAGLAEYSEYSDRLIVVRGNQDEVRRKLLYTEESWRLVVLFAEKTDFAAILGKKAHVIVAGAKGEPHDSGNDSGPLRRISREGLVKSIVDMGFSEERAAELARASGRSVPILRRRLAPQDSEIAKPHWVKGESVRPMIAAALTGCWNGNVEFDKNFVSALARMDYEAFEAQINKFRIMDDAPVEKIGDVWMVKSRIDALLGVAESIVPSVMRPFWKSIEDLLTIRNPALDLPDEERMFASMHGKTLPYSGELFSAVADTLPLLSAYHEQIAACDGSDDIRRGVERTVRQVLHSAAGDRWHSLCRLLPKLAEAAPDAFMSALEKDFQNKSPAIASLFSSNSEWPFRAFDHTGLLWALEILAWDGQFLPRVIDALVQMDFALPGNLENRPNNTLLSFFRPWFPQCGMQVDERVEQFRRLSKAHPKIAWHLSRTMVQGHDTASDNAFPRWSGVPKFASRKVTHREYWQMKNAAFDIMMGLVSEQTERFVAILEIFESLQHEQIAQFADIVATWGENASDEEKAEVRAKIVNNLYLCRLRRDDESKDYYNFRIKIFEELCEKLTPRNLILCHKWLFANSWVELPDYPEVEGRDTERHRRQAEAILEIYDAGGAADVFQMAAVCGDPGCVGGAIAHKLVKSDEDRLRWISKVAKWDGDAIRKPPLICGILRGVSEWGDMASLGFKRAAKENWSDDMILSFAVALHSHPDVWDVIERHFPEHLRSQYWGHQRHQRVRPDKKDVPRYVAEAMKNGRPDAALDWGITYDFHGVGATKVVEMLNALMALPPEQQGRVFPNAIDSYHIAKAMIFIAHSDAVPEEQIIGLEISLYEVIQHSQYRPMKLFKRIATDPTFFMHLICHLYKRKDGKPDEYSEGGKEKIEAASGKIYQVLDDWNIPPGCVDADNFNESQFREWIDKVTELARRADRLRPAEIHIGKVLKHSPKGDDGLIFLAGILQWLQNEASEIVLSHLEMAFLNSRGIVAKSFAEGGRQEREIAKKYRHIADGLTTYPRVATVFNWLAEYYEREGKEEDKRAELNDRRWD